MWRVTVSHDQRILNPLLLSPLQTTDKMKAGKICFPLMTVQARSLERRSSSQKKIGMIVFSSVEGKRDFIPSTTLLLLYNTNGTQKFSSPPPPIPSATQEESVLAAYHNNY